jgi:hypothetical protein
MSLSSNGQYITCDGDNCHARVFVPVGLRRVLAAHGRTDKPTDAGWLYVSRGSAVSHYCPRCKPAYLGTLAKSGVS